MRAYPLRMYAVTLDMASLMTMARMKLIVVTGNHVLIFLNNEILLLPGTRCPSILPWNRRYLTRTKLIFWIYSNVYQRKWIITQHLQLEKKGHKLRRFRKINMKRFQLPVTKVKLLIKNIIRVNNNRYYVNNKVLLVTTIFNYLGSWGYSTASKRIQVTETLPKKDRVKTNP